MPVLNRQGKMLSIYEFLTSALAFVIAIMLATTTILPESGLAKLRRARNILVPSYFVPIPDSRTEADFARNANRRLFLSCPFHRIRSKHSCKEQISLTGPAISKVFTSTSALMAPVCSAPPEPLFTHLYRIRVWSICGMAQ
jgi:hypothetical protein